jgi:lysozyme
MLTLKQIATLKFLGKIFVSALLLSVVFAFFQLMKTEPTDHTVCNAPGIECQTNYDIEDTPEKPLVDTAAIVQIALSKIQKEVTDDYLSSLAGRKLWGIDISKYQTNINWHLMVKKNKPDFVFVKVTEGTTIVDRMYRSHKRNLEKHDILHGAYHFMSFRSSGKRQAQKFIRHAGLKKGNMVPVLDVEYTRSRMPSKRKVLREIRNYCSVIEKHYGVKPIIYTHPHLYSTYLKGSFDNYPLWICDYRNNPRHEWSIWQHTDKGRLWGYSGKLDKNVMKSDKRTLKTLLLL